MVLDLRNYTPFQCRSLPLTARNGATMLRIVLKAGFDILGDGRTQVAAEQPDIVLEDEWWGEPVKSAIRRESEVILEKPMTDLLVNGYACAPAGREVTRIDVGLSYEGRMIKRLRVSGDRRWERGPLGWSMSSPKTFTTVPVSFDRAFGGIDEGGAEPRNHVGMGYTSYLDRSFEGAPVPNVEFPDQLISSVTDRPRPAGFGVVARHWEPRKRFAGTYDAAWLEQRYPLLPDDFDLRFFQTAPEDQWIAPQGGERIDIQGMTPQGDLRVYLPPCAATLSLHYVDRDEVKAMRLETVLVEPTLKRLQLTWGASADIHGDPFRLLDIEVWQGTVDAPAPIESTSPVEEAT